MSISLISHLPEEAALQLRNFEINILKNWSWDFLRNCFVEDLDIDSKERNSKPSDILNTARNLDKGVNSSLFIT